MTLTFSLPYVVKKREQWYLSHCPALDVYSQGETQEKAIINLKEAIELFVVSCFDRGTLDSVLKECGFEPVRHKNKSFSTKNYLDVPIHLFAEKNDPMTCRV